MISRYNVKLEEHDEFPPGMERHRSQSQTSQPTEIAFKWLEYEVEAALICIIKSRDTKALISHQLIWWRKWSKLGGELYQASGPSTAIQLTNEQPREIPDVGMKQDPPKDEAVPSKIIIFHRGGRQ